MKKQLKKSIQLKVQTCITYESRKLSAHFPEKDRTEFEHRHNIVYFGSFPKVNYNVTYVGEADRRNKKRIIDHKQRNKSSLLLKYVHERQCTLLLKDDFKILIGNYKTSTNRKASESIHLKALKST